MAEKFRVIQFDRRPLLRRVTDMMHGTTQPEPPIGHIPEKLRIFNPHLDNSPESPTPLHPDPGPQPA